MILPAGVTPAEYKRALRDVKALRPYGTYKTKAKTEPLPPTPDPWCGSRTGYRHHRARGEKACPGCLDANTKADRRLRETGTSRQGSP